MQGHKNIFLTKDIEKEDLFLIIADGIWNGLNVTTASRFVLRALLNVRTKFVYLSAKLNFC